MADVQVEHGHTRIADALLEALLRTTMPSLHLRIVLAVIRLTYGWQKTEAPISVKRLAALVSKDTRGVERALSDLKRWGVLGSRVSPGHPAVRWVCKDFDQWSVGESIDTTRRRAARNTQVPGDDTGPGDDDGPGASADRDRGHPRGGGPGASGGTGPGASAGVVPGASGGHKREFRDREREGGSADPSGHSPPVGDLRLLNLLSKVQPEDPSAPKAEPDEKRAWLEHNLVQLEVDAESDPRGIRSLTIRYFKQYLRGERQYRDWARKQRLHQRKLDWQAKTEAAMAEWEAEEGHATAHR